VLEELKDELEDFRPEETLEDNELKLETELVKELVDEAGELELTALLKELVAGTAEDTFTTVTLELEGAIVLDEAKDELVVKALETTLDKLFTKEELGVVEERLATDEAGAIELEVNIEELAGVADDTGTIVELDVTELADAGTLLIKLEMIELGVIEVELSELELVTGVDELTLTILELLLEDRELNKLLKLETDNIELELLDTGKVLLLIELIDTGEDVELEASKDELVELEELILETLELAKDKLVTTDELLLEFDDPLSGAALNTTFKGLLHGIVKSKLIAKKLYCTRQVKPSPDVKVWALVFGAKIDDKEAKLSVKITAEMVM
jgi:hypothetical protein